MFNENIKQQCSDICSYFEKIFDTDLNHLAKSIILYGENATLCYNFALELARLANCNANGDENCECINCKWIKENKHPAIKTYSNIDNKNDNSKTVISIEQIRQILDEIIISSEIKRFYIFCGAQETKDKDGNLIKKYLPLNRNTLTIEAANSLLKSIEEPPENTYFIFITRDKEDMLPTIISRSQSFYIHSKDKETAFDERFNNIFKYYPIYDYFQSKEFINNLKIWTKENDIDILTTIDFAQNYLKDILKSNIQNLPMTNKITSDIFKFEHAKKQKISNFKDEQIWENLIYTLYKD